MPLGIIDWGIGGVGIYKLIKERRPDLPVVYFSDTGVTPYGKMSRVELVARLKNVIEYLESRGVTHIIVGCNAASTAIPHLNTAIPLDGVIETAVDLVARTKPRSLGLIGGRRTVLSGAYRTRLAKRGIAVRQRVAQPLSGLIESGDIKSDKLRTEVRRILSPLRNCSHILLACTHYPAILPVLSDFVSNGTVFIDPAFTLAVKVDRLKIPSGSVDVFLTSGDARQMARSAKNAFGVELSGVRRITI